MVVRHRAYSVSWDNADTVERERQVSMEMGRYSTHSSSRPTVCTAVSVSNVLGPMRVSSGIFNDV
jgi:hypothetical protein